MMTVPPAHRTEPADTAYDLMDASSADEGTSVHFFEGEVEWPCVVESTLVAELTICWW